LPRASNFQVFPLQTDVVNETQFQARSSKVDFLPPLGLHHGLWVHKVLLISLSNAWRTKFSVRAFGNLVFSVCLGCWLAQSRAGTARRRPRPRRGGQPAGKAEQGQARKREKKSGPAPGKRQASKARASRRRRRRSRRRKGKANVRRNPGEGKTTQPPFQGGECQSI